MAKLVGDNNDVEALLRSGQVIDIRPIGDGKKSVKASGAKRQTNSKQVRRGNRYNRKYDWSWLKPGLSKCLKKGLDYRVGNASMAQQVRQEASERGVSLSITEADDGLLVKCAETR